MIFKIWKCNRWPPISNSLTLILLRAQTCCPCMRRRQRQSRKSLRMVMSPSSSEREPQWRDFIIAFLAQEPSLFLGDVGQPASRHGTLHSLHVSSWGEKDQNIPFLMSMSRSLSRGACPRANLLFSSHWLGSSTPAEGLFPELSRIIQKSTLSSWPSLRSPGEPSAHS